MEKTHLFISHLSTYLVFTVHGSCTQHGSQVLVQTVDSEASGISQVEVAGMLFLERHDSINS